jgi:hypothetical protein
VRLLRFAGAGRERQDVSAAVVSAPES